MRELMTHHDGCGMTELCRVVAVDDPHPVNKAHHEYRFVRKLTDAEWRQHGGDPEAQYFGEIGVGRIQFQRGPRYAADSTPGTLDGAVLAVLIDRFASFQAGPFACPENELVLGHLREAQRLLIARAQERAARGVLGKNEK
jgi:hypothetical protein